MLRLFETHYIRDYRLLEGLWDFSVPDKEKLYKMPVPSCWEQNPELLTYRGKATYTKEITVKKECNLRLVFKGVSHTADVFFDDEFVVHHYNAYTPFDGIIKNVGAGQHTVRVEVDNSFSEASALHKPNDYYTYGGIIRSCAFEMLGDCYIKNVKFTPLYSDGKWSGRIVATVANLSDTDKMVDLSVNLCDKITEFKNITLKANETVDVEATQSYDNVKVWSHETPNLYYITSTLYEDGVAVDDLIDRTGFRTSETEGKKYS